MEGLGGKCGWAAGERGAMYGYIIECFDEQVDVLWECETIYRSKFNVKLKVKRTEVEGSTFHRSGLLNKSICAINVRPRNAR